MKNIIKFILIVAIFSMISCVGPTTGSVQGKLTNVQVVPNGTDSSYTITFTFDENHIESFRAYGTYSFNLGQTIKVSFDSNRYITSIEELK